MAAAVAPSDSMRPSPVGLRKDVQQESTAPVGYGQPRKVGRHSMPFQPMSGVSTRGMHAGANLLLDSEAAVSLTEKLLFKVGLTNDPDERKARYMHAVWCTYAMNSASQVVPARARIRMDGWAREAGYAEDVIATLGDDARRYFRYNADLVARALKITFDRRNTPEATDFDEYVCQVMEVVALVRGVPSVPWFAFDAAEHCTQMCTADRIMVVNAGRRTASASAGTAANALLSLPAEYVAKTAAAAAPVTPPEVPSGGGRSGGSVWQF